MSVRGALLCPALGNPPDSRLGSARIRATSGQYAWAVIRVAGIFMAKQMANPLRMWAQAHCGEGMENPMIAVHIGYTATE